MEFPRTTWRPSRRRTRTTRVVTLICVAAALVALTL